ncbi:MAG: acylphosphatase [Pseudomonadota bacterium]
MVKRFRANIVGKVQGVFFRAATREKAMALQIKGIVKNLPNGSVEVDAEGEDERLTDLLHWCHHGPPGARVDRVDVEWATPQGGSSTFSIVA